MMYVKELYNRKIVKAKKFSELNSYEKALLKSKDNAFLTYEDDDIFLEPDMTLGHGTWLGLGVWRYTGLNSIEILCDIT